MIKVDIFSGFLGAGKTTLIKKLIKEAYAGEKLVLIENEFGEIGIDGGFLKNAGINITEMNSGCICCSLVGDFGRALNEVVDRFEPERILIEPSGVGKLSDVIRAVQGIQSDKLVLNGFTTVVDANKAKIYMKNFGEFFNNQIENASSIILSHTDKTTDEKLRACVELLRKHNAQATIISTPWSQLDGKTILSAMEQKNTLEAELKKLEHEQKHHRHDDCEEDHRHESSHSCHEHEHEHEHHHHDGDCCCGHDHHEHHHADEVFTSWGKETPRKYTADEIKTALDSFTEDTKFGTILRAKGIVASDNGEWIHFDYIPGESDVRVGAPDIIGRLCVIGSELNEKALEELFGI